MAVVHKTIFKNTIWLSVAEIISSILLFFFTVFVAKYLGAEKYGQLAFALSIATLFAVLVDFGLGILTIREVARDKALANKYLSSIFTLRVLLSVVFLILMFFVGLLSGKGSLVVCLVVLTSLYMVFNHLMQACNAIFRAFERMKYEAIGKCIFSLILFGGGLAIIWKEFDLIFFGWVYAIAMLIAMLYSLLVVRKYFTKIRFSFDIGFWKYLIKESWPFALSLIFISVYYFMDTVMLGFMGQDREVGWYNAGYKIVFFVLLFSNVLASVIFPVISKLYKESLDRLKIFLTNFSKLMVLFAVPLGIGGVLLGPRILNLIFGEEYMGGALAFQILLWSASIIYISIVYGNSLQACDRQRIYVKGVGIGALVNVILNLILIPLYSLNGAAVATVLAELAVLVYMYIKLNQLVKVNFMAYLIKPIIASGVMGIVLYAIQDLNVILSILIGVFVYVIFLILIKGIRNDELGFYKKLVMEKIKNE